MDVNKYKRIVNNNLKKDNCKHNYFVSFISGGILGGLCELIFIIFNSKAYISLSIIFISSFLTALGVFDNLIAKFRSGLIIPTTGFAHSVTSSLIDAKREGLVKGLGSNMFHLAGSVVLYSVVASFLLVMLKVILIA